MSDQTNLMATIASKAYDLGASDCQCENCTIDRAIRLVIEALAQEAEPIDNADPEYGWHSVSGWLRSHLPREDT